MKLPHSRWTISGIVGLAVLATAGAAVAVPLPQAAVPIGFEQDRSAELAGAIDPSEPRNVIMIVGDGMDDSMITAARNYELGAGGRFEGLDSLPFTGAMTTYGLKVGEGPDYPIAYVSDSAPTASGWSTGEKTVDGRVSQGPSSAPEVPGEDYETVLQQYAEQGKLTGNVTTAELTDATPAAAASSINARACQGPANMSACPDALKSVGGRGSIAEQLVDNEVDVLMGGGAQRYAQTLEDGSATVGEYAEQEHGYRTVVDGAGLDAVTDLSGGPVLGLFADANMTPRYEPLVATPPPGAGGPAARCESADRGDEPDVAAMTEKSLQLLDNPDGFFLQVESAMIDKQEHAMDICGAIGDLSALDEVVQVAQAYQAEHPDTLIVVTGDHAHSTQIVGDGNGGRQTATLLTADGDPMSVAYSTGIGGSNHTGAQIRVAASGPQAANVTGVIDQTDLYRTLLGRTPSELPGPGQPEDPKPAVTVAAPSQAPAASVRRGLPVAVAASGARGVDVRVLYRGQQVRRYRLGASGRTINVDVKRAQPGRIVVVRATATGPGGRDATVSQVRVRR